MIDIHDLYKYSAAVRRRFANKLAELSWEEVSKNREASFYSMKDILLHMIDNEEWIVNFGIFEKTLQYSRRNWEEYKDMRMIIDHLSDVERKTQDYLAKADEKELKRRLVFELRTGKKFDLAVEDCLVQSFTEQLYHLGELIALLWQNNIEPPPMQWFNNNPRALTAGSEKKP